MPGEDSRHGGDGHEATDRVSVVRSGWNWFNAHDAGGAGAFRGMKRLVADRLSLDRLERLFGRGALVCQSRTCCESVSSLIPQALNLSPFRDASERARAAVRGAKAH